ncbi:FliM/FliN family flagellar motor switch protein [Duganella radicis]|uniref:Flagellar motor switch protein FliN n=1 Tax=Duganella radicis TaxID=551988 RepID=A0A6L6PRL2_9BURK|nr:FliM/FliN family flagellar motor switch protein [Duganella radicis]MTV41464.1 flagellar motor switch protein FliN [Duganella radicis]
MSSKHISSSVVAELVDLAELAPPPPAGAALLGGNLRLLDGVQVSLNVMVGEAHTTVGELMALQASSLLKIDRKADYPVDVMLNGSVVARGQLVVVDDNFGVRITEIAQAQA